MVIFCSSIIIIYDKKYYHINEGEEDYVIIDRALRCVEMVDNKEDSVCVVVVVVVVTGRML